MVGLVGKWDYSIDIKVGNLECGICQGGGGIGWLELNSQEQRRDYLK
jgi:hypothetical protein